MSGSLYLGVDPFFWFETHALQPDVPNLFHRWIVREILLETTPWENDPVTRWKRRGAAKSFRSVQQTNAWTDDGGSAHYVLRVERLGAG